MHRLGIYLRVLKKKKKHKGEEEEGDQEGEPEGGQEGKCHSSDEVALPNSHFSSLNMTRLNSVEVEDKADGDLCRYIKYL